MEKKAGKIASIISIAGHFLFLGMPALYNPVIKDASREIQVKIDIHRPLLIPKPDKISDRKEFKKQEEEKLQKEAAGLPESEREKQALRDNKESEERSKIESAAKECRLRYQDLVKRRIQKARRYPSWAEQMGIRGKVKVEFIVLKHGGVCGINIISSSGYKIFDAESVKTIKRALPFPEIPEKALTEEMRMQILLVFDVLREKDLRH
jgi:TonB family protein